MKIALVSPYMTTAFNNPAYYNSQQINIAKNLASLGNQVTIFTKKLDDIKDEVFDYSNGGSYNIYYLDPVSTFGHWIVLKGLLKKIGHSYDIIMVNEDFQFTTLQLSYFKKKLRSKLVIFQGVYEFPEKRFWNIIMRGYSLFFSGYIIKRCDLVIAKTEAAKVFMEKKGYKEVIRVPIGVDTDIFYRQPLTKKDYFLYVGDLVKRRDLGTIIKGIKAANKRLLVIGDGEEKEKLKKFAEDLNVDVDFLGKVENKLLSKYYSEAQGFIFASTYEIFGMVLLEAMACGCPVITTPVPATSFFRKDKELLIFNEGDYKQLANYLNNPNLEKIGKAGEKVAETFSWLNICKKYFSEFNRILNH